MSVTRRPPSPAWQCLTGISKHRRRAGQIVYRCASRVACGLINLVCKRLGFQLRRARGLQESKGPSTLRSKAKFPLMLTEVEANLQQAYHKSVAYHHCWAVEVPPCHSWHHVEWTCDARIMHDCRCDMNDCYWMTMFRAALAFNGEGVDLRC